MERILSKEEISELLSAVKQGEIETENESDSPDSHRSKSGISRYDLVRLPGADSWKIPNLDIVLDAFGHNFSTSLTNRLQRSVNIKLAEIESCQFEPTLMKVIPSGAIGILGLDPCKTGGLLTFDEDLAAILLEIQLGGSPDGKPTTPDRAMTAIEANILAVAMKDCCPDLEKAFSPVESIKAKLLKIENNPRLVNIVAPDTGVMLARFTVVIDEFSGIMTLIIPHVSLEPMRERLRDSALSLSTQHNDSWPERLQQEVCNLRTTVAGQIAEVNLRLRDILNFQVGDVIELGPPRNANVKLMIEGQHKFNGLLGNRNGSRAIRIDEILYGANSGHN